MEFKDLKFKKQTHGGIGTSVDFEGFTVSIQAGSFVYSTPREDLLDSSQYSSFEVAIFDKEGRYITEKFIKDCTDGDVSGWTPKETIEELLSNLA
jgi:hypothetical protein|tara:strand:- start:1374 stop:1658 length:285 start_codon:yes stop_codon:yes gene_type:complete